MPGQQRNALAPRSRLNLAQLLQQAVHPDEDDALDNAVQDIIAGRKKLLANREIYDEADRYYDGDLGMVFASEAVQKLLERQGLEELHDFNYAAIPVDRISARLQVSSVVAAPADENEAGQQATEDASSTAATKAIAKLRKDNQLDAEEKRLWKEVSRYGEEYLFVWPGNTPEVADDGTAKSDDSSMAVDMRVNSPYHVVMIYDDEDPLQPLYVLKCWTVEIGGGDGKAGKDHERANLYYSDHIERWTTEGGGSPEKKESWSKLDNPDLDVDVDDLEDLAADEFTDPDDDAGEGDTDSDEQRGVALDLGDIPNPHGRVPWFHFRNDRPCGRPEHRNAYGPQQLINKLVWGLAGTIDYATFPQRYQLMDPQVDDPLQNLSNPIHPDAEDDDPENEGGNSGLSADPGAVWKLWGKSVGQFSPADITAFLSSLDRIVRAMAELTGLPVDAFSRDSASIPSGESRREANADFIAIIKDRQECYDPTLQDAYEFALKIMGITGVTVDVRWKPAQLVNDLAGWQVIQAKIATGVPPKVALEEAGYPPEQVDEWLKDATGADLGRRVALLNQIATATQMLGASIVTGAVSAEQVQALIAALFADTMAGTDFKLPAGGDYVDPQAALKAQQAMQDKQLGAQKDTQQAQLEHATTTQQTSQEHQMTMAEAAHARMQETMQAGHQREDKLRAEDRRLGPSAPVNGRGGGRRPGGRR